MSCSAHRLRGRAAEDGFALIEVMAAAALLAVMIIAVYTSFDFDEPQLGREPRSRAVAASLASADQERLRATPVAGLRSSPTSAPRRSPTRPSAASRTPRRPRPTGSRREPDADLHLDGAGADYLKIVSVVTAKDQPLKPVTITSVVTPPVGTFGAARAASPSPSSTPPTPSSPGSA